MAKKAQDVDTRPFFETYLKALRKTPVEQKTEHTDRGAMEALLQSLAALQNSSTNVQHEPKRNEKGAPDFKVQNNASIIGYVENKKIGENLDKILKTEQIAKYQTLSRNIIVNDYLEWIWLRDGKIVAREKLCYESDLENRKAALKPDHVKRVADLIFGFLSVAPEGVGRASELALALATRAHLLRDYLAEELVRQEKDKSQDRLFGLYGAFKTQVFHDLTLQEFADAFAQTLAYGLFLAALNSERDIVTLRNAPDYVPSSFRLFRELVEYLPLLNSASYTEIKWVVEEILNIINTMDVAAIHEDLSFQNRKASSRKVQAKDEEEWRLFSKDPFIYFYEDFLGKYDAKLKKSRGVYYTPPPVVNFIVRAIDDILKDTFGIADGLADHKRVTVLDFACDTGTFLVEVLEKIFETIGPDSGKRDLIIKEHILKNIFGFEFLIAPYTIAHLKLSQYLNERQYKLTEKERLQIYLTNTLEPIEPQKNFNLPELTRETEAAQSIKDKPILVITGNPPYSGHSK
ncbi:MAG: N-6 DNA methylase, partial [Hyphomicrobiales bacterium]